MSAADADYIIVGAGSAGCVLADRLTADGRSKVLLLEAGPTDATPLVSMPKGFGKLLADPKRVHYIPTAPDGDIPGETWIRGKMLGGSSSVNGMMYFRGHPEDYEEWVSLGATGWGWDVMSRAFTATERQLRPTVCGDHGELGDRLIAAAGELGVPHVENLNHEAQFGVGYAPRTIRNGRRVSAAEAFLKPAKRRANLQVETGVSVDRVTFEGTRATGVLGRRDGAPLSFSAKREVIICTGGLFSPQLLQRSGIGAASDLSALGIQVVRDAPGVGSNLLEHRLQMMHYRLNRPISANPQLRGLGLMQSAIRYALRRTGALAAGSYDVGAFFKSDPSLDRPDCELLMAPYGYLVQPDGTTKIPNIQASTCSVIRSDPAARVRSGWQVPTRTFRPSSSRTICPTLTTGRSRSPCSGSSVGWRQHRRWPMSSPKNSPPASASKVTRISSTCTKRAGRPDTTPAAPLRWGARTHRWTPNCACAG